jgi:Flp pilus assembly protein TadG
VRSSPRDRESGVSVVEVVLLMPVVVGFVMLLVCFGILVDTRGTVQGAARDAARMGSLQHDGVTANTSARTVVGNDLGTNVCTGGWNFSGTPTADFAAGHLYTVTVTCAVSLTGLDWFNLGTKTFVVQAAAPLDVYRRSG